VRSHAAGGYRREPNRSFDLGAVAGADIIEALGANQAAAAYRKSTGSAPMKRSLCLQIVLGMALAGSVAGCQTERRNIPVMTIQQANQLPASQVPRIFRDPSNPYGYPYNIHETDGLSRNPDDCIRWGCIDTGGNK
jgi:hypothetical protein